MVDTPSIPPTTSGSTRGTASSGQVVIKIPGGLSKLVPGDIVNAVVIRHENVNNSLLSITAKNIKSGELPIASRIPLAKNSILELEVLPTQHKSGRNQIFNFEARIKTIDGHPPQSSQSGKLSANQPFDIIKAVIPQNAQIIGDSSAHKSVQTQVQAQNQPVSDTTILNISNGSFVTAKVVNPSIKSSQFLPKAVISDKNAMATSQQSTTPHTALKASDHLTLYILSTSKNAPAKPSINQSNQRTQPSGLLQSNTGNITSAQNTPNLNISKGISAYQQQLDPQSHASSKQPVSANEMTENFASRSTSASSNLPPSQIAKLTTNPQFTATVIGIEKSGEAVLSTPLGTIKLSSEFNLTVNTQLTMETIKVTDGRMGQPIVIIDDEAAIISSSVSSQKAAISTFIDELRLLEREYHIPIARNILPEASMTEAGKKAFMAKILWFVSNIYNNSPTEWIGAKAGQLLAKQGQTEALRKLENSFQQLKLLFSEPNQAGWNNLLLPIYHGGKLEFANFYSRRDKKDGKDKKDNVRFLVEATLDKVGEIQIDGLVKNSELYKKPDSLDLVIRSHNEFSDEMQGDIRNIFVNTNEATGLSGSLIFQTYKNFPVHPLLPPDEESGSITA